MKTLLILALSVVALAQAPQYPVLPGGGGGGAVSSVFGRTGAVTATSGDYSASQVTGAEQTANKDGASGYAGLDSATKLKYTEWPTGAPRIYYCPTSGYASVTYTCSTGASLSTPPPTGTMFLVDLLQACTDPFNNGLIIDGLAARLISWPDGTGFGLAYCSSGAARIVIEINTTSPTVYSYSFVSSALPPICFGTAGGILYNNNGAAGCGSLVLVSNTLSAPHFGSITLSTMATPTPGPGAGTSPSGLSIGGVGSDTTGTLNVTTGTAPSAASVIIAASFGITWRLTAPQCTLSPNNAATALLSGVTGVYVSTTTTAMWINAGATGLTAATAYSWVYSCHQ